MVTRSRRLVAPQLPLPLPLSHLLPIGLLLLIALLVQFFVAQRSSGSSFASQRFPFSSDPTHAVTEPLACPSSAAPTVIFTASRTDTCPTPAQEVEYKYGGFYNRRADSGRSMALADEARRVAAEFDLGAVELNKGVKEFLREMDEGMRKDGATLSQIPTYVTAVPNGTEEVRLVGRVLALLVESGTSEVVTRCLGTLLEWTEGSQREGAN